MEEKFSLINKTRVKLPLLPLEKIKNDILGKKFSLSIALVDEKQSQKLNRECRKKDAPTNILSFVLGRDFGEIILCPKVIKGELKKFDRTFDELLGFLVIHGMLHLKGMEHGSTMEESENKYDKKYFRRHRCGLVHDACRGRRIFERRKKT